MNYQTPAAIESAIKEAAKQSSLDTNRAIILFWWDRFLARVFSESQTEFVLKGGVSLLARMSTRYTKDIDLAADEQNIEKAQQRLCELASVDLDDFFHFELATVEDIKVEDDYRDGKKLIFDVLIGRQKRGSFRVDLVVGCAPVGQIEEVIPAHQLAIKGLSPTKYLLYPLVDTIADKVNATMSAYPDGKPSSRVKDLVDLVLIVTTTSFLAAELHEALTSDALMRGLSTRTGFSIPVEWKEAPYLQAYLKLASEAELDSRWKDINMAELLIADMLSSILSSERRSGTWNSDCNSYCIKI